MRDHARALLAQSMGGGDVNLNNYASHGARPLDVASALDVQPSSGGFRTECGAAIGYGLTEGGPNAPEIALTPLGKRVTTPTEIDDDKRGLVEAALKPTVASQFYTKYDGSPLPPKNIAQNVLTTFGVPKDRTSDVYDLLFENAKYVGLVKTIKDKDYIDIGGSSTNSVSRRPDFSDHVDNVPPVRLLDSDFVRNTIFGEALYRARPIPLKVAETMRECGAAILVFTADKEYFDAERSPIWSPSENVSHELGAASVLYGERIVVFKEKRRRPTLEFQQRWLHRV